MATKRLKRPRDPIELSKLIGDILTGQVEDETDDGKNPAAVELGRLGGLARAAKMAPEMRVMLSEEAALIRWGKKPRKKQTD